MTDHDQVRASRAALAWLLPSDLPAVRALLATSGPVDALRQLTCASPSPALAGLLGDIDRRKLAAYAETATIIAARVGARILIPEDGAWPPCLADLAAAPTDQAQAAALCLWVRGTQPLAELLHRSVAVVGARAATAYGTNVARDIGYDLAAAQITTVGTGAFGVESAAHRGSLTGGGASVAVLPGGIDHLYPPANASLLDRIAERGAVLTPWPPGTPPTRARFLATAPLLASLATGTVLVEASARSTALRALRHAIALGRPAMVIPGPVTSALSVGNHQVLREYPQARLVRDAADVLAELAQSTS